MNCYCIGGCLARIQPKLKLISIIACGSTSCDHCDSNIYIWNRRYRINKDASVGDTLRTTLCLDCYVNDSVQIEGESIPDFYLHLSKRLTGHDPIFFERVRCQTCLGPRKIYNYSQFIKEIGRILTQSNQPVDMITSKMNLMNSIANLHWKRETAKQNDTPLLRHEIEILKLMDKHPDYYISDNFAKLENPQQIKTIESRTITRMSV